MTSSEDCRPIQEHGHRWSNRLRRQPRTNWCSKYSRPQKQEELLDKGKQMFIACADEWLEIVNLQISGKKRMNANDFLNGMRTIEDYHCTK